MRQNNLNNTQQQPVEDSATVVFRIEDQLRRRRCRRPFAGQWPAGQLDRSDAVANQRQRRRRPAAGRRWRSLASHEPAQPRRHAGHGSRQRHPEHGTDAAANQEYQDILTQIDTIGSKTQYNGIGSFTSGTGVSTAVAVGQFNSPGAGAALTVTLHPGDVLSGSVAINSAVAPTGTTIVDMGYFAGLDSTDQTYGTAAAAGVEELPGRRPWRADRLRRYTVTMNATTGLLSITTGNPAQQLSAASSSISEAAPAASAVNIYTSDGTTAGSKSYGVTVGVLSRASVGSTNGGGGQNLTGSVLTSQGSAQTALTQVTTCHRGHRLPARPGGRQHQYADRASNIASAQQTNVVAAMNTITATDYAQQPPTCRSTKS